jgi:crotonobetainyl-CoA:carnitine CoA-transferase CaiB-like acyl-CoA transferase
MGEPQWLADPRFANDDLRGRHGELISERMQRWCATRTSEEALTTLGEARFPAAGAHPGTGASNTRR